MLAQVLAIIIFLAMFLLIILEIWERQWITLACGLLTLLLVFGLGMHSMGAIMRTLNLQSFFTTGFWYAAGESSEASSGINWQTIIFIAGMMIMVEGMAKVGFFRWLCMEIAKMVKYQVIPIFMTFMLLSFVLAMFIDSITVILFLAAVTIELSQLLEFDPVPMILSEIFWCQSRRIGNDVRRSAKHYHRYIPGIFFHRLHYQYWSDGSRIPGICRYLFLLCI